jgi:membrane protein
MIDRAKRVWRRLERTQLWRTWKWYGERRGNRLAGASTFYGFISMYPLIVLAAAIVGKLLSESAVERLKRSLKENLPVIGDKIDIDALIANAGTIGLISAVALLFTGLGWIDAMRASIRSMHDLNDQPGNFVRRKVADLGALLGLGLIFLLATATSSVLSGLTGRIIDWLDIQGTWLADWGLAAISALAGILTGAALFLYLQTALPRIILPRKVATIAALVGGVVFFLAQKLGNLYVDHVIRNNAAYGTLALPLALLVWVYLLVRIVMMVAAWAKEATLDIEARAAKVENPADLIGSRGEPRPDERRPRPTAYPGAVISQRRADKVSVAAGAVLGATATAIVVATAHAARTVVSGLLRR